MITRKPKSLPGLDCSGPCKVLPPTFAGIKKLVERVGFDEAAASCAVSFPDSDASHDMVREFLADLTMMDAVERQTAISEFSAYVENLKVQQPTTPPAGGAPAPEVKGEPSKEGEPATEE